VSTGAVLSHVLHRRHPSKLRRQRALEIVQVHGSGDDHSTHLRDITNISGGGSACRRVPCSHNCVIVVINPSSVGNVPVTPLFDKILPSRPTPASHTSASTTRSVCVNQLSRHSRFAPKSLSWRRSEFTKRLSREREEHAQSGARGWVGQAVLVLALSLKRGGAHEVQGNVAQKKHSGTEPPHLRAREARHLEPEPAPHRTTMFRVSSAHLDAMHAVSSRGGVSRASATPQKPKPSALESSDGATVQWRVPEKGGGGVAPAPPASCAKRCEPASSVRIAGRPPAPNCAAPPCGTPLAPNTRPADRRRARLDIASSPGTKR
jgi:hypothetical protein